MLNGYRTVFETSLFSNWTSLISLAFLGIGLGVTFGWITGRFRPKEKGGCALAFMALWSLAWVGASTWWVGSNLKTAWVYTSALRNGRCGIAEGVVRVLRQQPAGGHAAGDRVRIGDREFEVNYYRSTLAYNQTIAHGGALTDGTRARVHYLDGAILKVEIFR